MSSLLDTLAGPNPALERLAPRNPPKKPADGETAFQALMCGVQLNGTAALRLASAESDGDSLHL